MITRYEPCSHRSCDNGLSENAIGRVVLYTDHAAEVSRLEDYSAMMSERNAELLTERDSLRAQLEAAREQLAIQHVALTQNGLAAPAPAPSAFSGPDDGRAPAPACEVCGQVEPSPHGICPECHISCPDCNAGEGEKP